MKRVKIMLTAIAILATVGGALAFKANSMRQVRYCIQKNPAGICTVPVFSKVDQAANPIDAVLRPSGPCNIACPSQERLVTN